MVINAVYDLRKILHFIPVPLPKVTIAAPFSESYIILSVYTKSAHHCCPIPAYNEILLLVTSSVR